MPKKTSSSALLKKLADRTHKPEFDEIVFENDGEELESFMNLADWKTSRKGNLWRNYDGYTVTIFPRDDGHYGWCISSSERIRYSSGGYETQAAAMEGLGCAVITG